MIKIGRYLYIEDMEDRVYRFSISNIKGIILQCPENFGVNSFDKTECTKTQNAKNVYFLITLCDKIQLFSIISSFKNK